MRLLMNIRSSFIWPYFWDLNSQVGRYLMEIIFFSNNRLTPSSYKKIWLVKKKCRKGMTDREVWSFLTAANSNFHFNERITLIEVGHIHYFVPNHNGIPKCSLKGDDITQNNSILALPMAVVFRIQRIER